MNEQTLRNRTAVVVGLLALWLTAAMTRNAFLAGPGRARHLEAGRKIALHTGDFHLPRARLLDRDGVPLAWSEKYFDLVWDAPLALPPPPRIMAMLKVILPGVEHRAFDQPAPVMLQRNLSPAQLVQLQEALRNCPELKIRVRAERIAVGAPELRARLGETAFDGSRQYGVSGEELRHDAVLAGTPGRYEVMLDRYRNWIDDTWKIIREARPGVDVKLDFSIAEQPEK